MMYPFIVRKNVMCFIDLLEQNGSLFTICFIYSPIRMIGKCCPFVCFTNGIAVSSTRNIYIISDRKVAELLRVA